MKTSRHQKGPGAFTLVEVIVAVAILGMVTFMVFQSLLSVVNATKRGAEAADQVQRERVAIKTVEDGLRGMVFYEQNQDMYALIMDLTDPDYPYFSCVSRVPPDYIGSREFNGQTLRRLAFLVENIDDTRALVLEQSHVMRAPEGEETLPVIRSILVPNLDQFIIYPWSTSAEDWVSEWPDTNSLPSRVKVEMALTRLDGGNIQLKNIVKREVVIHSVSITKNNQNPDIPAGSTSSGSRGSRGGSRGSTQASSRSRYTPEQIAAWRKKQAEQSNRSGNDGRSRYTDAQREAYRKRMAELYKRGQSQGQAAAQPRFNLPPAAGGQPAAGQPSSGAPGIPGAISINDALMDYEGLNGQPARNLQQLVDEGYLPSIPAAPDGMQWVINQQGNVSLAPL